jgi:hypothetical protein
MDSIRFTWVALVLMIAVSACTNETGPPPDGSFSFFVIDRCASVRPISSEDNFTDIDGEPIETDDAVILGITVSSQTPTGSEIRVRFAQEPSAELQQVRTPIVESDKKILTTFAIDIPGQYVMTVGGATAPNGATGHSAQSFIFEAPDEHSVCDKSTLGETSQSTTVP